MRVLQNKVQKLEERNSYLENFAIKNHAERICKLEEANESLAPKVCEAVKGDDALKNQIGLEYHHKAIEAQEEVENQNLKKFLFLRTNNFRKGKSAKKQLLDIIGTLGESKARLAKEGILNVCLITGRSSCFKIEVHKDYISEVNTLISDNRKRLEQNNVFLKPFSTKETRLKREVLIKMASKLKQSNLVSDAFSTRFTSLATLITKKINEDSSVALNYLEAMREYGHLLRNETSFRTRMHRKLGHKMSILHKTAILLL